MNTQKRIEKEVLVNTPVNKVWDAWTTEEGAKTFFAPDANIELKVGGKYEILFDLNAPKGKQGGEGVKILSFLTEKMLSFDWNAPPQFGALRDEKTFVIVMFEKVNENQTKITLTHMGWIERDDWNKVYDYFMTAWDIVLGRLKYCFEKGPIDWENPYRP